MKPRNHRKPRTPSRPLLAPPLSYYDFGQLADRLVAVGLGYDGSIQPIQRASAATPATPAGAWNDVNGKLSGGQAPAGTAILSATIPDGNSALLSVEFSGWSLPYPPNVVHILGPSWPFGQTEVPYNMTGNVGTVQCLKRIDFRFTPAVDAAGNRTATLTWVTGTLPVVGTGSVSLDAKNMKLAYIVLRVNGANGGQIVSSCPLGSDSKGNQINTLAT